MPASIVKNAIGVRGGIGLRSLCQPRRFWQLGTNGRRRTAPKGERLKDYVKGIVAGLVLGLIVGIGMTAFAQEKPAPPPAAPAAQTLDEVEGLMVQLVIARAQTAQSECNSLESMKSFNATKAEVIARIEKKHAGYTIDLSSGKLVAKK